MLHYTFINVYLTFHFKTRRVPFIYNSVIYISLHNWKINAYLSKVKDFKYLEVLFLVSKKETNDKNSSSIWLGGGEKQRNLVPGYYGLSQYF